MACLSKIMFCKEFHSVPIGALKWPLPCPCYSGQAGSEVWWGSSTDLLFYSSPLVNPRIQVVDFSDPSPRG